MSEQKYTPGPWVLGEYNENLGYDCMTGGIRCGPVVLDGADYGQKRCREIAPAALKRMKADAQLISAALDLLAALKVARRYMPTSFPKGRHVTDIEQVDAAIAKAEEGV